MKALWNVSGAKIEAKCFCEFFKNDIFSEICNRLRFSKMIKMNFNWMKRFWWCVRWRFLIMGIKRKYDRNHCYNYTPSWKLLHQQILWKHMSQIMTYFRTLEQVKDLLLFNSHTSGSFTRGSLIRCSNPVKWNVRLSCSSCNSVLKT